MTAVLCRETAILVMQSHAGNVLARLFANAAESCCESAFVQLMASLPYPEHSITLPCVFLRLRSAAQLPLLLLSPLSPLPSPSSVTWPSLLRIASQYANKHASSTSIPQGHYYYHHRLDHLPSCSPWVILPITNRSNCTLSPPLPPTSTSSQPCSHATRSRHYACQTCKHTPLPILSSPPPP